MITSIDISNYGPISNLCWENLGKINLVIGPNKSGKTYLLKALYSAIKTVEAYRRGKDVRKDTELLFDRLYWTFQVGSIGRLVKSGAKALKLDMTLDGNRQLSYTFGPAAERQPNILLNTCDPRPDNSIFIPAKEILSLQNIIIKNREIDQEFGFDNTYYDLAKALTPTTKGRNYKEFSKVRNTLEEAIGGHIEYDEKNNAWIFKEGNRMLSISMTSEGVKKLSILGTLLGNHYLSKDSVIFIDEPESALHPQLVSTFMDIIMALSKMGIQFFIASHSYFVIKKLYLLAHQHSVSLPVISFDREGGYIRSDLREEMPANPIIDESIRLYTEEIDL